MNSVDLSVITEKDSSMIQEKTTNKQLDKQEQVMFFFNESFNDGNEETEEEIKEKQIFEKKPQDPTLSTPTLKEANAGSGNV